MVAMEDKTKILDKKTLVIGMLILIVIISIVLLFIIKPWAPEGIHPFFDEDVTQPLNLSAEEVKYIVSQKKEIAGKEVFQEFEANTSNMPIEEVMESIEEYERDPNASLKDRFYECASITKTSIAECSKIENLYRQIECIEAYHLFNAINDNNPELCEEFGNHKINNWCRAFLTKDESYCNDPLIENEAFKRVCIALAREDLSACKGTELNCYLDYDLIVGRSKNDATLCDNYAPYTTNFGVNYCKALVNGDYQFCLDNFYYGLGDYSECC